MELTIENLIKIIIGVIVIVLVVFGLFALSGNANDFFKNIFPVKTPLSILR